MWDRFSTCHVGQVFNLSGNLHVGQVFNLSVYTRLIGQVENLSYPENRTHNHDTGH